MSANSLVSRDNVRGRPKNLVPTGSTILEGVAESDTSSTGNNPPVADRGSSDPTTPTGTTANNSGTNSTKKSQSKLKSHARSQSHNKLLTKLASPSSSMTAINRPGLNRSKSTDGLLKNRSSSNLKRNNRSVTKLSGLQPLKPTMSNPSIRSNRSTGSLKGMNPSASSHLIPLSGLKSSGRKGKAILRLNEDNLNNEEYEDLEGEEGADTAPAEEQEETDSNSKSTHFSEDHYFKSSHEVPEEEASQQYPRDHQVKSESDNIVLQKKDLAPAAEAKAYSDTDILHNKESYKNEKDTTGGLAHLHHDPESSKSSTDDLTNNLYGGSLLLSQSTGLTKKIDNAHERNMGEPYTNKEISHGNEVNINQSFSDNATFEPSSGISFKANPIENSTKNTTNNVAEPVTTNKNVIQNNSYQPNQTIFNNLQRTNSQYLNYKKANQNQVNTGHQYPEKSERVIQNGVNNFSDFLTNNQADHHSTPHSIETRAQQRLWLQRENSLLDISNLDPNSLANFSNLSLNNLMFANSYNNGMVNQSPSTMRDPQSSNQQQSQQAFFPLTPGGINQPVMGNGGMVNGVNGNNGPSNIRGLINQQNGNPGVPSGPGFMANSSGPALANENNSASISNINGLLMLAQNSHQNSIQSRTEFERMNREYLNVRRHLNPIGESLNRVDTYLHGSKEIEVNKKNKKRTGSGSTNGDNPIMSTNETFKETSVLYQEKEHELNATLNRLWQEAMMPSQSSVASSSPLRPSASQNPSSGLINHALQAQRPINNRLSSFNHNPTNAINTRMGPAPTTRAVKLAQANSQPKKKDSVTLT